MCSISLSVSSHSSLLVFIQTMEEKTWDCCRMAKSSFLPRRNKGYFGQKVTKTLFGNSPNINGSASAVLQKLLIEQTKSRSGRCNDNALIESKNGSVIRKHMGHWHIPKYEARKINGFYRDCFNEFLCFHRMCAYPTTIVLDNGKKKKVYEDIMTPVQKLLSIPNVERYLKEDVTMGLLPNGKIVVFATQK